jgi:hypothetical protein
VGGDARLLVDDLSLTRTLVRKAVDMNRAGAGDMRVALALLAFLLRGQPPLA